MKIAGAYAGVVAIWSTTPLALKWSTEAGFVLGLSLRLVVATVIAFPLVLFLRGAIPMHSQARRLYLAGGATTFLMLVLSNWSAQFIPSGWLSVAFGLTPIVTSLMSAIWLDEPAPTRTGLGSLLLSLLGLGLIFGRGIEPSMQIAFGIGAVLLAVLAYSWSLIWIKLIDAKVDAISSMTGTMFVALVLSLAAWYASGAPVPETFSTRTVGSILYLGSIASVIGFSLFYVLMRHLDTTRIALINLITPVTSLLVGHFLNDEPLNGAIWTGTALVLAGLIWFEFGSTMLRTR